MDHPPILQIMASMAQLGPQPPPQPGICYAYDPNCATCNPVPEACSTFDPSCLGCNPLAASFPASAAALPNLAPSKSRSDTPAAILSSGAPLISGPAPADFPGPANPQAMWAQRTVALDMVSTLPPPAPVQRRPVPAGMRKDRNHPYRPPTASGLLPHSDQPRLFPLVSATQRRQQRQVCQLMSPPSAPSLLPPPPPPPRILPTPPPTSNGNPSAGSFLVAAAAPPAPSAPLAPPSPPGLSQSAPKDPLIVSERIVQLLSRIIDGKVEYLLKEASEGSTSNPPVISPVLKVGMLGELIQLWRKGEEWVHWAVDMLDQFDQSSVGQPEPLIDATTSICEMESSKSPRVATVLRHMPVSVNLPSVLSNPMPSNQLLQNQSASAFTIDTAPNPALPCPAMTFSSTGSSSLPTPVDVSPSGMVIDQATAVPRDIGVDNYGSRNALILIPSTELSYPAPLASPETSTAKITPPNFTFFRPSTQSERQHSA